MLTVVHGKQQAPTIRNLKEILTLMPYRQGHCQRVWLVQATPGDVPKGVLRRRSLKHHSEHSSGTMARCLSLQSTALSSAQESLMVSMHNHNEIKVLLWKGGPYPSLQRCALSTPDEPGAGAAPSRGVLGAAHVSMHRVPLKPVIL